jgi:hypothetical protein|nr:MAG TPA: hypothetical protein [Caudoviricetes sp.]
MKYTELTNKRADDACRLEAPDFGCCPRCPPPCRPKCCPRTHVWDAVDVFGDEAAHKFALLALTGGTLQVLPAHWHCIELVITERGWCDVLAIVQPVRTDAEGQVWFDWPEDFLRLPAGYYEADVKIDGKVCHTMLMHKIGCVSKVVEKERQFVKRPWQDECIPDCCEGNRPSPDIDENYRSDCDVQCF